MVILVQTTAADCSTARSRGWIEQRRLVEVALREQQHGVRDRIRHLVERGVTVVVERVASQMVARVVLRAGGTAVDPLLLRSLDALSAGEQAARRDTRGDERAIVRAPVERRWLVRQPLRSEVVEEDLLDRSGAGRPNRAAASRVVAGVDEAHEVRRADHVEVQVQLDLILLGLAETIHVERGADQAFLLTAPPGEAQLVARVTHL